MDDERGAGALQGLEPPPIDHGYDPGPPPSGGGGDDRHGGRGRDGGRHGGRTPRPRGDRVPPHSLEAEVSVLGAAMLSQHAASTVTELLSAEDFYRSAHATVFEAITDLVASGTAVDMVTVLEWIRARHRVDEIGGPAAVASLVEGTPTAANAEHYATKVRELALLRRLIEAGTNVVQMGFEDTEDPLSTVGRAEAEILRVGEMGANTDYTSLGELLVPAFKRLEQLSQDNSEVTGLPTGFDDLDRLTAGLQPENLIIIAARPAMGKCLVGSTRIPLADGRHLPLEQVVAMGRAGKQLEVLSLDADHRLVATEPSEYHDNGILPVRTLTTFLGRRTVATGTHPFLTPEGWRPLDELRPGDLVAAPRTLPALGEDARTLAEVRLLADVVGGREVAVDDHARAWLAELGMPDLAPRERPVPDAVHRLPTAQLRVFLSHLAATRPTPVGRGARGPCLTLRWGCERLARDVQHLLLRLGFTARLEEVEGRFDVVLEDPDALRRFLADVGIACDAVVTPSCDEGPSMVVPGVDDVAWDVVASIEDAGEQRVYDLTVPEHHNFVADDLVTHNSSFSLNLAQYVTVALKRPAIIFSLEMSKIEIVNRMLSAQAGIDSNRIKTGRFDDRDWRRLSDALGQLSEAPLFIDDTPSISMLEIAAKCRRLKQKQGLDLVVIDYLQLMQSHRKVDSRQQEVAEISRGLKMLAKDLKVPVIALSQLSRQPESRVDKRPMLADLRESGCLTRDSRIVRADTGALVTFGELLDGDVRDIEVWARDEHERLVPARLTHAFPSGVKRVFRVQLRSGLQVDATANHPFLTLEGWRPLGELAVGDRVGAARRLPEPSDPQPMDPDEVVLLAHLLGEGTIVARQPVHYTSADPANLEAVEKAAWRRFGITARHDRDGRSASTTQLYLPSPHRLTHGVRNPIAAWLDELGVWDRRAHDKHLPAPVFALPDEQVRQFLHHLWATDGCIWVRPEGRAGPRVRAYYATASDQLARDVQLLLLRLGIRSTIARPTGRPGTRQMHHVTITGAAQLRRFLTLVGAHGDRGRHVAPALAALDGVEGNPNVDTVPREVWTHVRARLQELGISQRRFAELRGTSYGGTAIFKNALGRERLGAIAELLDDARLRDLATSDLAWDEIVSIEDLGEQEVFDATVEQHHSFVCEGVVLHNSIEQDADIVAFIYRDEVYDEQTPDKGIAELIVAKHRNGQVRTVRLAFLNHLTKFANLAPAAVGGGGGGGGQGGPPMAPPPDSPL